MQEASRSKRSDGRIFPFRHSEALLRAVMENAAVGMGLIGTSGRLIYVNRAFAEMLGYEPAECIGFGPENLMHPDYVANAHDQLGRLVAGDADRYRAERRYLRKDGSTLWVLAAASVLRSELTGRALYSILQVTDIDRQKRAEAALAESESRWNLALEGGGQGVWDHDLRRKEVFYSRVWKLMRGLDPEGEANGANAEWLTRVHPDDRERVLTEVREQQSGEVDWNTFEYRERHRDGHWIWILSRGRPIEWLPDGSVARIVGTDTDITSLKAVQAALDEERERLKVTLESIGDGVISADAKARVTFMNPTAEHMTGWTSAEAIGRSAEEVFTIVDEASGNPAMNPIAECLAHRRVYHPDKDAVLIGRLGGRRDVRVSAAPVRTPQAEIVGAVLVFHDVTESRALQKELAHSATHDSLTGLPNRSAFERALGKAADEAQRECREHALCFIDLDHFKNVNDSAGHAAGDGLLKQVGETIRRGCRAADFAARIGGDEFALLLADCSMAGARLAVQGIVDAIAQTRFVWLDKTYEVGASAGITAITSESARPAALMAEADVACYAAKSLGRNRVSVYATGPGRLRGSA